MAGLTLFASLAALASAAKPLLDYTFGGNCPFCKKFDTGAFLNLTNADGITDAVAFDFHLAVRTAGDPTTDHDFRCPDEPVGCPISRYAACALNASAAQAVRLPLTLCWGAEAEPTTGQQRTETCGPKAGLSALQVQNIVSCAMSDVGTQLLVEAAQYFMGRFPMWAKLTGPYNVPHVFVDDQDQYGPLTFDLLLAKLCADGAQAAACDTVV